ncbi:AMP-binding protein [Vibrio quintilis]|uniref:Long-chain-fatty-acid--CoA ligase FadD15 n=1 Tax=Vibrio quintilis TaxID=1117707 RepID=A0A1M7Z0J3_9VIBR|nr:AMP-binding protein [Vibrio quintilis]SHO58447.1 Long-chain-fatty-acid--CoA ligase FadD15 [Vibrio quintilis]
MGDSKGHDELFITPDEYLLKWAQSRPDDIYLKQIRERKFDTYTFSEVADQALRLVTALQEQGLKPQDKIAIISKNCAEWFICDLAMMLGDFISVPIFPTANFDTIDYCISHSECRAVFVGKLDNADTVRQVLDKHKQLSSIALPYPSAPECKSQFSALIQQHEPASVIPKHDRDAIMSIVYTSGTSGTPKGAMLSYGAFFWTVRQLTNLISVRIQDRLFSYLPLSHITERVYIFGVSIMTGVQTAFPESLETFIEDVRMQRPTLFISVPRLWTLFQQRILDKLPQSRLNLLLKIPFIRHLIQHKIARGLGLDKARILGCGSAPVSPGLLAWYDRIGLPITEAWGMTESLGLTTLNYPYNQDKIGTVGITAPGVRITTNGEGEVLVQSPGVFSGYYKNELATRCIFDHEGWMKTGDLGKIDAEDYLSLSGRKKDTFKTAKGKFVSPVPIEKLLYQAGRFEMLCLIGLGLPGPILLVVPHDFPDFDRQRYEHSTCKIIQKMNQQLQAHEQIKGVLMIKEPWTIENSVLTPTLKIKRFLLESKYHELGYQWPENKLILWEDDIQNQSPASHG